MLWFRRRLSSRARDVNWHHVIGYWSLVPLAVIIWSAVVIGYPWASDLTFRMAGETPPRAPQDGPPRPGGPTGPGEQGRPGEPPPGRDRERGPAAEPVLAGYRPIDELLVKAGQQAADWTILSARLPTPRDPVVQVVVDTGFGAQPQNKSTVDIDRATGEVTRRETFEAQSAGRQWRSL